MSTLTGHSASGRRRSVAGWIVGGSLAVAVIRLRMQSSAERLVQEGESELAQGDLAIAVGRAEQTVQKSPQLAVAWKLLAEASIWQSLLPGFSCANNRRSRIPHESARLMPIMIKARDSSHGVSMQDVGVLTAAAGFLPIAPMNNSHRTTRTRPARGFTVLELMVTFAIIGLLLAILLPAIGVARQAARRTQCQNNLKQIGLALLNYHEHCNIYPPGYIARGVAVDDPWDVETGSGFAWGTMLLPFVDQAALESMIDYRLDATDSINLPQQSTRIHYFFCPASPMPSHVTLSSGLGAYMLAPSNYVGVYGYGDLTSRPGKPDGRGAFFRNSSTTTWSIKDGLSNTILVSERSALHDFEPLPAPVAAESIWSAAIPGADRPAGAADHPLMTIGPASLVLGTIGMNAPGFEFLRPNHTNFIGAFSSGHDGGLHLLRADGSVKFTSDSIDEQTLRRLMQIDDGEVTNAF
jgi:prepilin-type N-terminal cleavage/methylation domain-containing protein